MWLTSLSIKRPLLIIMAVLAIMLGGVVAYRSMAVDLYPNVKIPVVAVVVYYPGAGPREVEARITKPIENAVAGAPGVKKLTSTSGDGYSMVILEFSDGLDPDSPPRTWSGGSRQLGQASRRGQSALGDEVQHERLTRSSSRASTGIATPTASTPWWTAPSVRGSRRSKGWPR